MTHSAIARLLALVLALAAGFGPGAVALAHGHAHEHLADARAHGAAAPHQPVTLGATGHGDDHAHQRLDASAMTARGDFRLALAVAALPPAAVTLELPAAQSAAARVLTTAPPRAGPAATPPPSRAPPLG